MQGVGLETSILSLCKEYDCAMSSDPPISFSPDAETLCQIFDALPYMVILVQPESEHEFRVLAANRDFFQTTGIPPERVIRKTLSEVIPLYHYQRLLSHLQMAVHSREPAAYVETLQLPFKAMTGKVTITPCLDEQGQCTRLVISTHEITPAPPEEEICSHDRIPEVSLRESISVMHQVCRDLSEASSLDELSRLAVEYGHSRLGFDRLSLWFLDPQTKCLTGSYGIDESGQIRDERQCSFRHPSHLPADIYLLQDMPITREGNRSPLYNNRFEQVGVGELYSVVLSDGQNILGVLFCDNLLSGKPLPLVQREILVRYAHTIALLVWKLRTEAAINAQNERYRIALQAGHMAVVEWDFQTDILTLSPEAAAMMKRPPDYLQIRGSEAWKLIHPDDLEMVLQAVQRALAFTDEYSVECRAMDGEGDYRWIGVYGRVYADGSQNRYIRAVMRDIAAEREIRESLYQAQKMDAIGRLAGGIAHDFNNLLTIILGALEMARTPFDSPAEVDYCLHQIEAAARRATDLTRQLLAFARKQPAQSQTVDLNHLIERLSSILPRMMGEDIRLHFRPTPDLWKVQVNSSQIEQVILNLAANARDAMPHGGDLILETRNIVVAADRARRREDVSAGEYVLLIVRDTGTGIAPDIQERVFEPFFTTKEIGKGTGLGLATSYGIVQQNGGAIRLESRLGEGTSFYVYLPRWIDSRQEDTSAAQEREAGPVVAAPRCVLVVEDEPEIRRLAVEALKKAGYIVLNAGDGAEALQVIDGYDGEIDLLFTDIVMPTMGGRELAAALQPRFPKMQVLYTSGYTAEFEGIADGTVLLHKPYRMHELLREANRILSQSGAGA
jgi:PAS domain S-box-containing protein